MLHSLKESGHRNQIFITTYRYVLSSA